MTKPISASELLARAQREADEAQAKLQAARARVGTMRENLVAMRAAKGMSQRELNTRAQLGGGYVWKIETGRISPGLDVLKKLAAVLGVTAGELVGEG